MSGINNMIEVLDMISNGIDPLTGEVVDVENLKKDSAFQNALKKLIQIYRRTSTGGVYAQFEATDRFLKPRRLMRLLPLWSPTTPMYGLLRPIITA